MKTKKLNLIVVFAILHIATCGQDDTPYNDRTVTEQLIYGLNDLDKLYQETLEQSNHNDWHVREKPEKEYDFIVIGGGSAGCVVASRLSEVPEWTVALMESGQPETDMMDIPLNAPTALGGDYDWKFVSEPQKKMGKCLGEQRMTMPRGKCLGGSSCINYMMYCRGNKIDYIFWALLGNIGWSYNEVICYFKKSENATLKDCEREYHGEGGYLNVGDSYRSEMVTAFTAGGKELGLDIFDYNAALKAFGLSPMQATIKDGRRNSAARAFIQPVADRENLSIFIGTFVTRIIIDEHNRACGVEMEKGGKTYIVRARKEVILSAGAIQTPQLLQVSGIGPRWLLRKFGIKCLKNLLGVGKNLKDHLTFYALVYTVTFDAVQSALYLLLKFPEFLFFGTGPWTAVGSVNGVGYVRTPGAVTHEEQPDIELMFVDGSMASGLGNYVKTVYNVLEECYNSVFKKLEGKYTWTVAPLLLHPNSSGWVRIVSADPHVPPSFDFNYYSDKENRDIKTMIKGIRVIQRLFKTEGFIKFGAKLVTYKLHGCEEHVFDSDAYWECALRAISITLYHPIGTAKMGPKSDPMAVVNHHLQVYGIKGLRVADASVMPSHISGHPNAASIMIGERCGDFIKQTYGKHIIIACEVYGVGSNHT